MSPATLIKGAGLVLAFALVLGFSSTALAQDPACVNDCIIQWDIDLAQCEADLSACQAQVQADLNVCLASAGGNIVALGACIRQSNLGAKACNNDFRLCRAEANTVAYNCYRDCFGSPSAP